MKLFPFVFLVLFPASIALAGEKATQIYFSEVRHDSTLLRHFLYSFPKGGDLHNHLDGAIYAESYIAWAAQDGLCINLPCVIFNIITQL